MNTLDYFLKANLYGLLFAGCYWLLLRRHTFFELNRTYLLVSAILALTLPFVSLPTQTVETLPVHMPVGIITLPAATRAFAPADKTPVTPRPNWEQIGLTVYGLIALGLVARFLIHTIRLVQLIRRSPRQVCEGYVRVQPDDPTIPTFSFFRYIIFSPDDTHNELIIQHELVHVRQLHSADVLGLGIIQAVFWACPTLGFIDRLLRQVHEFLADKPVPQPTAYARFLVDYSFGTQISLNGPDTLTNSFFNPSLLKQRIVMLHRKATNRWALSKYALVLPLAFGLLAMTTARKDLAAVVNQVTDGKITVSGRVTSIDGKPLPGANVVIANTGKGTITNAQGNYTLQYIPKKAQLSVSLVGFTTQVVSVGGRTSIDVALAFTDPNELPAMGATALYKAIKPNPTMPVRTPPTSETINGKVYTAVEEPAVFPTGIPGLMQYVAHTLRYPAKARTAGIQGNVFVKFVVLPTGAIGSAKIKKGLGSGCNEEALRVVRQMPHWIPAKQNGKAVATQYVIPIQFALEKKEDKRTGRIDPERFHPTDSPIGEFPAVRDVNYPKQLQLTTVIGSPNSFQIDSTPQPNSEKKTSVILDNSRSGRFALYNDVKPKSYPLPDSLRKNDKQIVRFRSPAFKPPLYILDGVEISADSLKGISPNNIESLNVYKNASATAMYGEKGKNGVIIITSKKK